MKFLVFGTCGYHPSERRQTACLMLPETGIVLDAGTGFFRVREHLATPTLDILLTHAHLDHVVGLTYLLSTLWAKSVDRVTVHGEAVKLTAIQDHLLSAHLFPVPLPCQWQSLAPGRLNLGPVAVTWFPLDHPGGAVGYRLDWANRSLAYVTDTTASPTAPYVQAISGVDLLIHECNFRDDERAWALKTGHSFTSAVAQVAVAAAVKRLLLVHFNPLAPDDDPVDLAAACRIFPATELASDGMEIEL